MGQWHGTMAWTRGNLRYALPGKVGDRLYVRETFARENNVEGGEPPHANGRPVLRRPNHDVDGIQPQWTQPHNAGACERLACAQYRDHDMGPRWRPAIHMRRSRCLRSTTSRCRSYTPQKRSDFEVIFTGLNGAPRIARVTR